MASNSSTIAPLDAGLTQQTANLIADYFYLIVYTPGCAISFLVNTLNTIIFMQNATSNLFVYLAYHSAADAAGSLVLVFLFLARCQVLCAYSSLYGVVFYLYLCASYFVDVFFSFSLSSQTVIVLDRYLAISQRFKFIARLSPHLIMAACFVFNVVCSSPLLFIYTIGSVNVPAPIGGNGTQTRYFLAFSALAQTDFGRGIQTFWASMSTYVTSVIYFLCNVLMVAALKKYLHRKKKLSKKPTSVQSASAAAVAVAAENQSATAVSGAAESATNASHGKLKRQSSKKSLLTKEEQMERNAVHMVLWMTLLILFGKTCYWIFNFMKSYSPLTPAVFTVIQGPLNFAATIQRISFIVVYYTTNTVFKKSFHDNLNRILPRKSAA